MPINPQTMEQAIVARLKTCNSLEQLTGGRIYPQATSQDPSPPSVVIQRVGAESGATLGDGAGRPRKYILRVDCFGRTEAEVHPVGVEVVNALHQWKDHAKGIQGVFHTDSETSILDDTTRVVSHTFAVWFRS